MKYVDRKPGWWTQSRPYRVMAEFNIFAVVFLAVLMLVMSNAAESESYRLLGVHPIFWVGVCAGGLGGCARGMLDFWRRDSYELEKRDYWKHLLPLYIGVIFGFLMVPVANLTFRAIGVESTGPGATGLSVLAMLCMLSGLFTDYAEALFSKKFTQVEP